MMKQTCENTSPAYEKALEVMRLLETHCGIYDLKIDGISIWWFIRGRFHAWATNYFDKAPLSLPPSNWQLSGSFTRIGSFISMSSTFLLRSCVGIIRTVRIKLDRSKQRPIIFFDVPSSSRGRKNSCAYNILMDPIYNKIADRSIMIEMGTLSVWDINSLWHLKNAIFFDWLMFFSIFISLPRFHKAHQAEGWSIFETKCRSVDFGGIPSEQVLNGVKRLIKQSGLKVLIQVRAAKMLINTFKPSLLVEADYSSTPRALNFAARLKDIPIVELQHGIIHKSHPGYAYFVPANYQEQRPLPNKILVWGEAFKQIILEAGNAFDPGDIVVTGYPRLTEYLDAIARSEKQDVQQKVRTILDVNEGSILITITSSSEVGSYLCDLLAEILKKLTGNRFVFCVKLHPRELDSWKSSYKTIATDPHIRFLSDNDVDLYDLLVASDIHATVSSTVFLECFALGIPNFFIYHPVYSSSGMGLVDPAEFTVVKTPDSFIDEFKRLTEDSTYREKTITTGRTIGRRFFATEVCAEDAIINELNRFA